jgi:thiol-disulfide isomerase/thioredoxin
MYYLSTYVDKNTGHIEKGLQTIFSYKEMNEQVYNYTFNELMKLFISLENEHIIKFLSDNFGSGCSLDLSVEELKKLYSIQHTQIGSKVPEILLFDSEHKAKSLLETAKQNKLTIAYFWLSWCAHCQKTTPELAATYDLLHKKGLEVYAVSLDEAESEWQNAILANKSKWINVAELTPIKNSTVAKTFNLSKTPTLFVINEKGEIIAKNIFGEDLKKFLEEYLK